MNRRLTEPTAAVVDGVNAIAASDFEVGRVRAVTYRLVNGAMQRIVLTRPADALVVPELAGTLVRRSR